MRVTGEVETHDAGGVVRGAVERLPDLVLSARDRSRPRPDEAIRAFAQDLGGGIGPIRLATLHRLLEALHRRGRLRHRADPRRHHGRRGLRAAARRLPGPDAHLHRRRPLPRHSRPATSPAISTAPTASSSRRPGMPGRRPRCRDLGWVGFDAANGISAERGPCARRHRPRLSRRGPDPRQPHRRRLGGPRRLAEGRQRAAPGANMTVDKARARRCAPPRGS